MEETPEQRNKRLQEEFEARRSGKAPGHPVQEETPEQRNKRLQEEFEARRSGKAPGQAVKSELEEWEERAKNARIHVVEDGDTLSQLALEYYGSAIKDKWMIIYEANKAVIGDNPNRVRLGTRLIIPELEK